MFRYATSLAAGHGILWVARWDLGWRVVPHDFDGRELGPGFAVPPESAPRAAIASIAVDADRRIWLADAAARRVRAFTAFGRELDGLSRGSGDRVGGLEDPIAVDAAGVEADARIAVASAGPRRHALHLVRAADATAVSLRPRDQDAGFAGLGRVAFGPRGLVVACEPGSGLVLAWRDGQFHFAFRAPDGGVPSAVRVLGDGRIVLALASEDGGAVHLVDAGGRPLRAIARAGPGEAAVSHPEDLALDEVPGSDRRTRVAIADAAGSRIQVFNLEGDCHGAFGREDDGASMDGADGVSAGSP